ncbi:hypothetical protein ACHHRT_07470 [Desulfurivibrio sp. D14AmB]|uniref:hypothetical protein n=1 Tax=Desulfurivibrio sp. D14AmB TaxID=3374370 RepID=UPI00376EF7D5
MPFTIPSQPGTPPEIEVTGLKHVGIVGVPPRALIARLNEAGVRISDLDALLVEADFGRTAALLPQVYCGILRTVVLNALHLAATLDAIIIDIGPGKCDGARYTAEILRQAVAVPVFTCQNLDQSRLGNPICRSNLPLLEKLQRITAGVLAAEPGRDTPPSCPPSAGFWGVPPRDFSLLELFPADTHVYGWSRCMENKTPADHLLEIHCRPEIPTVFFAQSFCPKTALARYLADRHPQALYLDADLHCGGSAKAKIQAFLELSGVSE